MPVLFSAQWNKNIWQINIKTNFLLKNRTATFENCLDRIFEKC